MLTKEKYLKRKAEGICVACGREKAMPGHTLGEACSAKRKKTYKSLKEQGICPVCRKNKTAKGFALCDECRAKYYGYTPPEPYTPKYGSRIELTGVNISDVLMDLRQSRDMTKEDVARALGVESHSVRDWESGRHIPNLDNIEGLLKAYGCRLMVEKMEVE